MKPTEQCQYGEGYPQVRKVTYADREALSKLILKFVDKSGNEGLVKLAPKVSKSSLNEKREAEQDKLYDAIRNVLEGVLYWVHDDAVTFFMSLINVKTKEEFSKLPFDIDAYIITSLLEQRGFRNFFLSALKLYNWIQG